MSTGLAHNLLTDNGSLVLARCLQLVLPFLDLLGDGGMGGGYGLYTEGMGPENRADLDAQFQMSKHPTIRA